MTTLSSTVIDILSDDLNQVTRAMKNLEYSVIEATEVSDSLSKLVRRMREVELMILSDLLSQRSSRIMRES